MTDKTAREILREWSFVERCGHYPHTEVEKPCPHCDGTAQTILAALEAGGFELARKHKWFKPDWMDHECCQDCGIVRRADDRHRPCLGPVRVGLRPHMPLKDEYTESLVASNPKEEGR